ncbi:RAD52 motif-containing protein 1 [Sceloporus undulatus]|uniref:RAD52 motif-containing protein 1 n=1 Tax=Sceloporus undulatus TaxID=8520 RepID=UPI001C4B82A8|nr:RAD52 motif-containing protein 1 [Sceloporus undulatus]
MAEVIEFRVPVGNGRTLLVLGVDAGASEHALYLAFAAFGPLYSVKLQRNAPVAGPGYYALVKFYSARDAKRAQCACNQKPLFQKSPLKVSMCTRQRAFPHQPLVLNSYKCRELANHYLGFNGWSSRIITLQNISGFEEVGNEEEEVRTSPRSQQSKYLCVQELTIPQYEICTRGVGVAELQVDPSQGFLVATHSLQKLAVQRALSDAFQKILLVVLENGKVAVEYSSPQDDPIDCLIEEDLRGLIQVTDLSLSDLTCEGEEEILSDHSIEEG